MLPPLAHTTFTLEEPPGATGFPAAQTVLLFPADGKMPVRLRPEHVPVIRPDGAYLITGGLGGLGLHLARYLAAEGAAKIVLNGRTSPDADTQVVLDGLRRTGTTVNVVTADGTAPRLVREAVADGHLLRGVAHAAAVVEDAAVARLDAALLTRVWAAKADGAWNLHRALGDHNCEATLDWWAGFSSAVALLGNPGQAAYATANGWLDALTLWRRSQGLTAHSTQWGFWAGQGKGAHLAEQGAPMITPTEGTAALHWLLCHDRPVTGYLPPGSSAWFSASRRLDAPFFTETTTPTTRDNTSTADHGLHARLHALPPDRRHPELAAFVAAQAAAAMGYPGQDLPHDRPLNERGFDSLMALILRNRIHDSLGVRVPAKAIWRHNTPNAMADYLAARLTTPGPEEPAAPH